MATVRYRPLPSHQLLFGPVAAFVCQPTMTVTWLIDDGQMDPLLGLAYASVGTRVLQNLSTITADRVRVHRDPTITADQLIDTDVFKPDCIDVLVPADLVTREVARELGRHSTCILRTLKGAFGDLPLIGEQLHIPR